MESEVLKYSLLLDFYGPLLAKNQLNCLDLYYNEDLSITEIAEELLITRQAVYDSLKNGRNRLQQLEEKLLLVEKFSRNKDELVKVEHLIKKNKKTEAIKVLDGVIKNGF